MGLQPKDHDLRLRATYTANRLPSIFACDSASASAGFQTDVDVPDGAGPGARPN